MRSSPATRSATGSVPSSMITSSRSAYVCRRKFSIASGTNRRRLKVGITHETNTSTNPLQPALEDAVEIVQLLLVCLVDPTCGWRGGFRIVGGSPGCAILRVLILDRCFGPWHGDG